MKTALYIEDGVKQIVLTPESEHEKAILKLLNDNDCDFFIKHGSFYECQGGWVRQKEAYYGGFMSMSEEPKEDSSTMLVIRKKSNPS